MHHPVSEDGVITGGEEPWIWTTTETSRSLSHVPTPSPTHPNPPSLQSASPPPLPLPSHPHQGLRHHFTNPHPHSVGPQNSWIPQWIQGLPPLLSSTPTTKVLLLPPPLLLLDWPPPYPAFGGILQCKGSTMPPSPITRTLQSSCRTPEGRSPPPRPSSGMKPRSPREATRTHQPSCL